MEFQQYFDVMHNIQCKILNFLEDETNDEENYEDLKKILDEQKITEDRNKFKSLLYLIAYVGSNHYHNLHFFDKLEKILQIFLTDIKNFFINSEIYNIFEVSMRLLLFLFNENTLIFDKYVVRKMKKFRTYLNYFASELSRFPQEFYNQDSCTILPWYTANCYELRKIGENENEICKLIRNDNVKEFIVYINRNELPYDDLIIESYYETNPFLFDKNVTFIEYAAFFGSIQIFKYLQRHDVELTPSLWLFAIHGRNAEIIHELEENHIMPDKNSYLSCLIESIKCHHNDVANYFLTNYLDNDDENLKNIINKVLKFYNFAFVKNEFIDESSFFNYCKYDYVNLVSYFLKTKNIDVNEKQDKVSLLYIAVEKEHIEIINLLIKNDKLDINAYNEIDCSEKNESLFSDDNDDYDDYEDDFDDEEDDDDEIEKLLKTAFYLAVENENIQIINLLLTNDKLDINILNKKYNQGLYREHKTALYLAVELENTEIVSLLLKNDKINVNLLNRLNDYMETSLYLAVDKGYFDIIKLLLANSKIDINIPSIEIYFGKEKDGKRKKRKNIVNTPLHIAVEKGKYEIVKLLLEQKNVNVQIKNIDGKTPIECTNNEQIKQLFPR